MTYCRRHGVAHDVAETSCDEPTDPRRDHDEWIAFRAGQLSCPTCISLRALERAHRAEGPKSMTTKTSVRAMEARDDR
ncbi:hypothetical protein [Luteipulveratus mongoliensis]|uniref:Uncharacterized protein n=1 Tax=Luteipulveratus mongoliensis TaxID=571913 RepID=A0A0K1JGD6_9MICO|nr:hypothetical protein [Luteipulveratus mongoliensis]AKU15764.1 hypothetical protein VV02_07700 [Luteipulveratus mongoliensis]